MCSDTMRHTRRPQRASSLPGTSHLSSPPPVSRHSRSRPSSPPSLSSLLFSSDVDNEASRASRASPLSSSHASPESLSHDQALRRTRSWSESISLSARGAGDVLRFAGGELVALFDADAPLVLARKGRGHARGPSLLPTAAHPGRSPSAKSRVSGESEEREEKDAKIIRRRSSPQRLREDSPGEVVLELKQDAGYLSYDEQEEQGTPLSVRTTALGLCAVACGIVTMCAWAAVMHPGAASPSLLLFFLFQPLLALLSLLSLYAQHPSLMDLCARALRVHTLLQALIALVAFSALSASYVRRPSSLSLSLESEFEFDLGPGLDLEPSVGCWTDRVVYALVFVAQVGAPLVAALWTQYAVAQGLGALATLAASRCSASCEEGKEASEQEKQAMNHALPIDAATLARHLYAVRDSAHGHDQPLRTSSSDPTIAPHWSTSPQPLPSKEPKAS